LIELAPSILSANFAQLGVDALAAIDGGGTVLHLDVMDGHFVSEPHDWAPCHCVAAQDDSEGARSTAT